VRLFVQTPKGRQKGDSLFSYTGKIISLLLLDIHQTLRFVQSPAPGYSPNAAFLEFRRNKDRIVHPGPVLPIFQFAPVGITDIVFLPKIPDQVFKGGPYGGP
jgi:hypothetical protein